MYLLFTFHPQQWLVNIGLDVNAANIVSALLLLVVVLVMAYLVGRLCVHIGVPLVSRLTRKSKAQWDDIVFAPRVMHKFFSLVTPVVVYACLPFVDDFSTEPLPAFSSFLRNFCEVVIVMMIAYTLSSMLNAMDDVYRRKDVYQTHPVKGILQTLQLVIYLVASIISISILVQESPVALLTGLGAAAAVLMLIFQDTILGFVSGLQLSVNKMLRVGDWITMNKYGVDGTVIEIGLNAVKIQNFDNTIVTLPPTALMRESFQNWRGMSESGGRRVKRSVYIDMQSVKFCTPDMLAHYKRVHLLSDYLDVREQEVKTYNESHSIDETVLVNGRHQTNLGVLRAYLATYLKKHPRDHLPVSAAPLILKARWIYHPRSAFCYPDIFD
jgi:miniconductance mechanosensitive channel